MFLFEIKFCPLSTFAPILGAKNKADIQVILLPFRARRVVSVCGNSGHLRATFEAIHGMPETFEFCGTLGLIVPKWLS